MDDVKLPDLSRLEDVEKRLKKIPPQESITDTSNWDGRNISVPVIDGKTGLKKIRQFDLLRPTELNALTADQIRKIQEDQSKKESQ